MRNEKIIKLLNSLRLPEEPQVRKEAGIYEGQAITNEWASQVDWVKETDNFNLNTINEIVENFGKSGNEKKIVIKAIYDEMWKTGEVTKIPYSVDKLLNKLYKKYDENGKGLLPSITTNELNPELISLLKKKMDEYIADKQNNNESSSDNSGTFLQQIEELKVQVEELKQENASLKEQAEEKTKKAEKLDKTRVEEIDKWHYLYESAIDELNIYKPSPESIAENPQTSLPCFTSKQWGIFIHAVAEITEAPQPPAKTSLGEIVEKISGFKKKTASQNLKGSHSADDKEAVAKAIEGKLPNLAAKIRKL